MAEEVTEIPGQMPMPDFGRLTPETKQFARDRANFFLKNLMGVDSNTGKLDTSEMKPEQVAKMLNFLARAIVPGEAAVEARNTEQSDQAGYFMRNFIGAAQEKLAADTGINIQKDLRAWNKR